MFGAADATFGAEAGCRYELTALDGYSDAEQCRMMLSVMGARWRDRCVALRLCVAVSACVFVCVCVCESA